MKPNRLTLIVAFLALGLASIAAEQGKPGDPSGKSEDGLLRIQELLDEPLIDTKPFSEKMLFVKFLAVLEDQLPKEKKISLRLDEEAFDHEEFLP